MIILAAGMPRAGSGWHYNLVHDLVLAAGGQDARAIRRRFLLRPFLTEVNCNIRTLRPRRLAPVLVPSMLGNTFAIKTHAGPSPMSLRLIRTNRMRVTYIYRDPRAALLSAFEYGQRSRSAGRKNAFARLETMDQAIDFIKIYLLIWKQWMKVEDIHSLRYEDLLANYDAEADRLARFLKADPASKAAKEAIEFYRSEKAGAEPPSGAERVRSERGAAGYKGQHFQVGEAERFRQVLAADQLKLANEAFGSYLTDMGYQI
jgi:hypothetical protein